MRSFLSPVFSWLALCLLLLGAFGGIQGTPSAASQSEPAADGATPVFFDRTAEAGLSAIANSDTWTTYPSEVPSRDWNVRFLKDRILGWLGGGIALGDLYGDGHIDAVVTRYNPKSRLWETHLLRNDGQGHFADVTAESGVRNSGTQIGAAIGDFDNDGLPDLYLVGLAGNALYRNLGQGRFQDDTESAKVADGGLCVSATFVDYDHDGDLDLYVSHFIDPSKKPSGENLVFPDSFPGVPNRMYRNNGNGTFSDVTETLGVGAGQSRHFGMWATDLDNDRDLDLLVTSRGATPQIFSNDRNDHFSDSSAQAGPDLPNDISSVTVADFNHDGAMDLFVAPARIGTNILLLNQGNATFKRDTRSGDLMKALSEVRFGSGALDFDSDGNLDLYVFRNNGGELFRNTGDGRFVSAGNLPCTNGKAAAAADFNGDGRPDIMYLEREGALHLLKNEYQTKNHWLGIRLEGGRSNRQGFGATVDVIAGSLSQKMEVHGHNGYLSQDSATLWIGLGEATNADQVTVRWPSGIVQKEVDVAADRVVDLREPERSSTFCPMLYTWNGKGFEFVTDLLGGSTIGGFEAPMQYRTPDSDEYIRIEGSRLVPKDGQYVLNLNNQLAEADMFDQVQLLVVDHPAGTEMYPNERLMTAPPFPKFGLHTAENARLPVAAADNAANDILPLISAKDRSYPDNFAVLPFKGYAETHSITLDLGDLKGAGKVVLLMNGWTDYADSSANLAAAQAGIKLLPPYLQVKDGAGKWKTVLSEMGIPAGLPKTIVVDLTGKLKSPDHHVRIVTNMCIYWDLIRVDTSADAPTHVTRLDPVTANLHFRGYPAHYSPDGHLPGMYDYDRVSTEATWQAAAGSYTRFGDVLPLLLRRDDQYVVTRPADEITFAFDAGQAAPLQDGWVRDFLLYADGYRKDTDINSLYSEVVGPLPFHEMKSYPYSGKQKYPDDDAHRAYQKMYNTRVENGGENTLLPLVSRETRSSDKGSRLREPSPIRN